MMTEFIATSEGKLINVTSIAYITTRKHPQSQQSAAAKGARVSYRQKGIPTHQLVIGFSAAGMDRNGMRPLSMVLEGEEAEDFLNQLSSLGLETSKLAEKVKVSEAEKAAADEAAKDSDGGGDDDAAPAEKGGEE